MINQIHAFFCKFISGYGSAKLIEIGQDLPKLLTKVYYAMFCRQPRSFIAATVTPLHLCYS